MEGHKRAGGRRGRVTSTPRAARSARSSVNTRAALPSPPTAARRPRAAQGAALARRGGFAEQCDRERRAESGGEETATGPGLEVKSKLGEKGKEARGAGGGKATAAWKRWQRGPAVSACALIVGISS